MIFTPIFHSFVKKSVFSSQICEDFSTFLSQVLFCCRHWIATCWWFILSLANLKHLAILKKTIKGEMDKYTWRCITSYMGRSRISPDGRGTISREGFANLLFSKKFAKIAWNWKKLDLGGRGPSLQRPLRSATDLTCVFSCAEDWGWNLATDNINLILKPVPLRVAGAIKQIVFASLLHETENFK